MKKIAVLGCAIFLSFVGVAQACDVGWGLGEPPTWEEMIRRADVVFVGRVIDTSPETREGWGRATFEVETWIKGGSEPQFEAAQGSGGNCVAEFHVGSHVIFAGHWSTAVTTAAPLALGHDTGWDAMVYLDDPPTTKQLMQLDYLETIAEVR